MRLLASRDGRTFLCPTCRVEIGWMSRDANGHNQLRIGPDWRPVDATAARPKMTRNWHRWEASQPPFRRAPRGAPVPRFGPVLGPITLVCRCGGEIEVDPAP